MRGFNAGRRAPWGMLSMLALCEACASALPPAHSASAPVPAACKGPLTIRGVADVRRISACTAIEGDLTVTGSALADLGGLERLRRVEGRLQITGNAALASLDGLSGLETVRTLVVADEPVLRDVGALGNVRLLGSATFIATPRLASLHGLERVRFLGGLVVTGTGIQNLLPLRGLHAVGDLVVTANPRLVSLQGLGNLEGARHVDIEDNPVLGDVHALDGMTWLGTAPVVRGNTELSEREAARVERLLATGQSRKRADGG